MCGVNTLTVIIQNPVIKFINKYLSVYTMTLLILNSLHFNKVDREFMYTYVRDITKIITFLFITFRCCDYNARYLCGDYPQTMRLYSAIIYFYEWEMNTKCNTVFRQTRKVFWKICRTYSSSWANTLSFTLQLLAYATPN
jgi:hypothetical protein